ncbi:hypothetical protein [Austwickia chelonae]|uniref:hypothetical protein n=1 Tax=Austwickia chelonae TaxID=100225 RepID=UPI000E234396|nr:hypothetical protein [Austwickia chelonae]
MSIEVVVPSPVEGFMPSVFDSVVLFLSGGFHDLGLRPRVVSGLPSGTCPAVLLAPHVLEVDAIGSLPADTILYNFEQLGDEGTRLVSPEMVEAMSGCTVWDYSQQNLRFWRGRGSRRCLAVPLGHHRIMGGSVPRGRRPRYDVVFYGSMNDRRRQVLAQLQDLGLTLGLVSGYYGSELDEVLAEARLVLNIHFYETAIMEIVRLSHLWANEVPVLTEFAPGTESFFGMENDIPTARYEKLADSVAVLLRSGTDLDDRARRARAAYAHRAPADRILATALRATAELAR